MNNRLEKANPKNTRDFSPDPASQDDTVRNILGEMFPVVLVILISLLAYAVIKTEQNSAMTVFNSLLPVVGTWVGTVLAYYFAKSNYEAASNSSQKLYRLANQQGKSDSTPVTQVMVKFQDMYYLNQDYADDLKTPVQQVMAKMKKEKFRRLPILDHQQVARQLFYLDDLSDYYAGLLSSAVAIKSGPAEPPQMPNPTMEDFLKDCGNDARPFQTVAQVDTLGTANQKMAKIPNCNDAFVTNSGSASEPVIGLLTVTDMSRFAQ